MAFTTAPTLHRHVRDTWSHRLTVTVFVAASAAARLAGSDHRAMVEPDPYGDAWAPSSPTATPVPILEGLRA